MLRRIRSRVGGLWDIDRGAFARALAPTAAIVCVVVATGYVDDRRSCERQVPSRIAFRDFARAQAVFQGGLATLEQSAANANGRATITDPDTGEVLRLNRVELRRWVQDKQAAIAALLPVPDCSTIPAGK